MNKYIGLDTLSDRVQPIDVIIGMFLQSDKAEELSSRTNKYRWKDVSTWGWLFIGVDVLHIGDACFQLIIFTGIHTR